ncbi:hypothetical protein [Flavobacterium seoulense]|uniref:Uncharacterized protein n=1 Tax=Flavobacterium seoulense TaxID=1492738 RepID=A0A066WSV6_9FLAO|nr:hypothetical protein [Flavobacterium seoulense]KDN55663.1 hypothetical protein FEM21_12650 [Flavobacterium seoulense]
MDFYTLIQIGISSIVATSVMTIFSYLVSASFRELYKEPVLLSYCISSFNISLSDKVKRILSWLIHYGIGFMFVLGYHLIWEYRIIEKSWLSALILGIISGIIGIASWLSIFKISKYEPNIDFKGYYLQLFIAHVLFALAALPVYNLF